MWKALQYGHCQPQHRWNWWQIQDTNKCFECLIPDVWLMQNWIRKRRGEEAPREIKRRMIREDAEMDLQQQYQEKEHRRGKRQKKGQERRRGWMRERAFQIFQILNFYSYTIPCFQITPFNYIYKLKQLKTLTKIILSNIFIQYYLKVYQEIFKM